MALVINDRVKETSTTTGTGTFSLAGAVTGFDTFVAGIADGNTTYYAIFLQESTEWEVGLGTVTDATPDTLARTTVITSSNSDSAVDFSAGTKDVFCTLPASKAVYLDANGNQATGVVGKVEGTNFTDSLLVGHSTTGTVTGATADNTGVGIEALDAVSSGFGNTTLGYQAGTAITTGLRNVLIGAYAGSTGGNLQACVYVGYEAGMKSTPNTGGNVGVGFKALKEDTNGYYNIAVGEGAGLNIKLGHRNVCLGAYAGDNITTGDGNVAIGAHIDPASATENRQLVIGGNDGSTTTTWITGDGDGNIVTQGTVHAAGGQLTTTGKAFVMGF